MPTARFLISPFDEAEKESQVRGKWMVATVEPRLSWPTRKQMVQYEEKTFLLIPKDVDRSPGIALRADAYGMDYPDARKAIMRFCSALSWSEGNGLEIVAWGGGNLPRVVNVIRGALVTNFLEANNLPSPTDDASRTALALYREGVSLRNPFYSFLSLFKAISVAIPNGRRRASWIEQALTQMDDRSARERRDALLAVGTDLSTYIWEEGRNAVAHAECEPYVNPDATEDHFRLQQDLPLIKNLAELAIEQVLGVKRAHTLWKEHTYELAGFKDVLGSDIIEKIKHATPLPDGLTVEMPEQFTVLARRGAEINAFEHMRPEFAGQAPEGLVLDFVSQGDFVRIRTLLNFAKERLIFDPVGGLGFRQDRTTRDGIATELLLLKFQLCVLSNGHIEIWDPDTERMFGRSETCIPVNCMVNNDFYEKQFAELESLLKQ